MIDYKTMYAVMFNAATDAIEILSAQYQTEALQQVISILQTAQLKCRNYTSPARTINADAGEHSSPLHSH